METEKQQQQQRIESRRSLFCAAVFAACLNGVAVGNLAGWPQAAIPQLLAPVGSEPAFTESQVSWIAGIFFLGMLAGGFTSLGVAGRCGKRKLFLLASVPLMLGWSVIAVAASFWQFIFGRIILGLGGGMICHQTEMYLSEISPQRLRSGMSVVFCSCVHIGVLASFGIGPQMSISAATGIYLAVVLALAGVYLMAAPETPFWLVRRGKFAEGLESLRRLRGQEEVTEEFETIVEFVERSAVATKSDGFWAGFRRVVQSSANRRALLLVVLLTTAQQFSGMAGMHSYAQLIFDSTSVLPGRYVTLMMGLIELCCTVVSGFVIERVGRRPLVAASCILCAGCMSFMGYYFHSLHGDKSTLVVGLVIACMVVFPLAYGLGLATMATVVAAECLSMDARNLGAAAQNTTVCFSLFAVTKLWQMISTSFGVKYTFWTAAIITAVHTIVLLLMLPETRGKTLVEIQRLLAKSVTSEDSEESAATLLQDLRSIKIVPAKKSSNGSV